MPGAVLPGLSACDMYACAHLSPCASTHIGSLPGVAGSSGMHVHPFVPCRSSTILPSAPGPITAASLAMCFGAAESALRIIASFDMARAPFVLMAAVLWPPVSDC